MHQVGRATHPGRATHQATFLSANLHVRYAPGVRYALGEVCYALGFCPEIRQNALQIFFSSIKLQVDFCPWLVLGFLKIDVKKLC